MQFTSSVQVYVSGITRIFFMFIRNTLCDIVVARYKQWLRMVSCIKKKMEIPALSVISDDVSKKKEYC